MNKHIRLLLSVMTSLLVSHGTLSAKHLYGYNSTSPTIGSPSASVDLTQSGTAYSTTRTISGDFVFFVVNSSTGNAGTDYTNSRWVPDNSTSYTVNSSSGIYITNNSQYSGYHMFKIYSSSSQNITITIETSTTPYTVSATLACSQASDPVVTTGTTITVDEGTATVVGSSITDYASKGITECGVWFGTSEGNIVKNTATKGSPYNTTISSVGGQASATMVEGATYHYKAFATNCHGTSYGSWQTYTYSTASSNVPVVRIGKQIKQSSGVVSVSGYVATTGGANVTAVTVYYSNNSGFRNSGEQKADKQDFSISAISCNNTVIPYQALTAAQVSQIVSKGEKLYVRIKAVNSNGISDYSDIVSIVYDYNQFAVNTPIDENVTACEGDHQFKFTGDGGMFNPAPDDNSWEVQFDDGDGDNAKDEFERSGDYMIWTGVSKYNDGTHSGVHSYYFTAKKNGYENANATANLNLSAIALSDVTVTVSDENGEVVESVSLQPWTLKTLTAVRDDGEDGIIWNVPDEILITVEDDGATAKIKGTKVGTYYITVRAGNDTCGKSPEVSIPITVSPEPECIVP